MCKECSYTFYDTCNEFSMDSSNPALLSSKEYSIFSASSIGLSARGRDAGGASVMAVCIETNTVEEGVEGRVLGFRFSSSVAEIILVGVVNRVLIFGSVL